LKDIEQIYKFILKILTLGTHNTVCPPVFLLRTREKKHYPVLLVMLIPTSPQFDLLLGFLEINFKHDANIFPSVERVQSFMEN
jgi:hypothetical protein